MTRAKLGSLSLAGLSILCLVCLQHLAEITHSNFPKLQCWAEFGDKLFECSLELC